MYLCSKRMALVPDLNGMVRMLLCAPQVLCASNDAHDQVEPILPPEGVPLGEKISFEG